MQTSTAGVHTRYRTLGSSEKIADQAANEAQAFTDGGKFEFLGHNYVLDHVDYFRVKVLD